jgi:hypothetical protein
METLQCPIHVDLINLAMAKHRHGTTHNYTEQRELHCKQLEHEQVLRRLESFK